MVLHIGDRVRVKVGCNDFPAHSKGTITRIESENPQRIYIWVEIDPSYIVGNRHRWFTADEIQPIHEVNMVKAGQ